MIHNAYTRPKTVAYKVYMLKVGYQNPCIVMEDLNYYGDPGNNCVSLLLDPASRKSDAVMNGILIIPKGVQIADNHIFPVLWCVM